MYLQAFTILIENNKKIKITLYFYEKKKNH